SASSMTTVLRPSSLCSSVASSTSVTTTLKSSSPFLRPESDPRRDHTARNYLLPSDSRALLDAAVRSRLVVERPEIFVKRRPGRAGFDQPGVSTPGSGGRNFEEARRADLQAGTGPPRRKTTIRQTTTILPMIS